MSEETKHTTNRGPWEVLPPAKPHGDMYLVCDADGFRVASVNPFAASLDDKKDKHNADHIVKCVNSAPDMAKRIEELEGELRVAIDTANVQAASQLEAIEQRNALTTQLADSKAEVVELRTAQSLWVSTLGTSYPAVARAESDNLRTQVKELREAVEPFAHRNLSEILGGNAEGDESIVFQRENAWLRIKHFLAARTALKATEPKV